MNIDLSGKHAIVCGSSQGIGRACAIELANLGASILLLARSEPALKSVQSQLNTSYGQTHSYIAVDFSEPETLRTTIKAFIEETNRIHILVNNTGGPPAGPVSNAGSEEFIQAFSNHLICNQILTQLVLPGMKSDEYGRVINIISTSVKQPLDGLGVSNTVRGAVANWAKTLANEVGKYGITVNNVLPGATNTSRLDSLIETKASKSGKAPERIAEEMKQAIPAARFGEPEELAFAVAFLASPAAGYINGINLPVDGGRTGCL